MKVVVPRKHLGRIQKNSQKDGSCLVTAKDIDAWDFHLRQKGCEYLNLPFPPGTHGATNISTNAGATEPGEVHQYNVETLTVESCREFNPAPGCGHLMKCMETEHCFASTSYPRGKHLIPRRLRLIMHHDPTEDLSIPGTAEFYRFHNHVVNKESSLEICQVGGHIHRQIGGFHR